MDLFPKIKFPRSDDGLKKSAALAMVLLSIYTIGQFVSIYQTRHQLVSPVILENIVWEISRPFFHTVFVLSIVNLVLFILFFFKRYILVVVLAVLSVVLTKLFVG